MPNFISNTPTGLLPNKWVGPSTPSTSSGTDSGTVNNGSGIIPTPTDPEDDQPGD